MKTIHIGSSPLIGSCLAYGCWRIAPRSPAEIVGSGRAQGRQALLAAIEAGYTVFDLADIYCDGESEKLFGEVLSEVAGLRERIVIATKCGIRKPGDPKPASAYRYDFSTEHIVRSCEASLRRLRVETIDLYQLHRPDYLMAPEEVAGVFSRLREQGKVREFGVSNFRPSQVVALQKACPMPLVAHQVEISLAQLSRFEDGTLDQCLSERMTPMAWSPLAGGALGDGPRQVLRSQEDYRTTEINAVLDELARERSSQRMVVALAWLLKVPSGIMPIVGSTNPESIRAAARADTLDLSREEWYELLRAARGAALP